MDGRRIGRFCVAAVAAAAPLTLLAAPASAADNATVTVVHGIPATPVDVYVDGTAALKNFQFKTVTNPITLPAGSHAIAVRPAGASPSSSPILSADENLTAGANVTLVANLKANGDPTLTPFVNYTSETPAGQARVVVRHTAAAPAVDVLAGNKVVVDNLINGKQAALFVPAGQLSASVAVHGTTTPVIGPVSLSPQAGQTLIVYAIGKASDNSLTAVTQSYDVGQMGSGSMGAPNSVSAGTGGQAATGGWTTGTTVAVTVLTVAGVGLISLAVRRRPARR